MRTIIHTAIDPVVDIITLSKNNRGKNMPHKLIMKSSLFISRAILGVDMHT